MDYKKMKANQLFLVCDILTRLRRRLFLLRKSLGEGHEPRETKEERSKNIEKELDEDVEFDNYTVELDCCDLEDVIGRIVTELKEQSTFKVFKQTVEEYEDIGIAFKKNQKTLATKNEEIKQLKGELVEVSKEETSTKEETSENESLSCEPQDIPKLSDIEDLMTCRLASKREFFEHNFQQTMEKTEEFNRSSRVQFHTDVQIISFWLLKYESCTTEMDLYLRKIFDDWSLKKRETAILKKYKKMNLEKIEKVLKMIAIREEVIEADRQEKEMQRMKEEEEKRRNVAATTIQAYWRGTMVRKQLGPYKPQKKKGKGKKKGKKN